MVESAMKGQLSGAGAGTNGTVAAPATQLVQITRLCVVRRSAWAAFTTAFQVACSTAESSTSGTSRAVEAMGGKCPERAFAGCVGLCRYFAARSWNSAARARRENPGLAAPYAKDQVLAAPEWA